MSSPKEKPDSLPILPGYEVLELLGEGGMGRVYLARQRALGDRAVCIKVFAVEDDDGAARERFHREARLLAMACHPHVLTILDFGTLPNDDRPYLITEYIENGDLRKLLRKIGVFPIAHARTILAQIGQALMHLHGKGILHRDLKPENILTPSDHLVKVADFGLAVLETEKGELTQSHRGIGTLIYASPEQQNGLAVDARSDQYSLAAVCYEILTGKRPVGAFKPPSEAEVRLDRSVDAVLLKALAHDPKDRYERLDHFLADLDRSLAPRASNKRVFAAIGLGLAVAGAGYYVLLPDVATRVPRPAGSSAPSLREMPSNVDSPSQVERSDGFHKLTSYRAEELWKAQGSPQGEEGEAVSYGNWLEAERQIQLEVEARAYEIWKSQGSPVGEAGRAVERPNQSRAERELLQEVEEARAVAKAAGR